LLKALPVLIVPGLLLLVLPQRGSAIPAFSRQYATSCMTCHIAFPKLNDFGKAFKDAGFKFPKDDEDQIKVAPVMLGAEAQKQNFPNSVWPGSIPGMPPIGLRFNSFFQLTGANRNQFNPLTASGSLPQVIPGADFASGFFSIFTAGNFGSGIAFWVDDDISVSGSNGSGGLGDAYLKFVNVGRFLKLPTDSFSVRVGQFELDLPVTQARSYNLSPYDIYQQANIGAMNSMVSLQQNVANQFTFANAAKGVEISGGHQYGGYHYSVAVVDQIPPAWRSPPTPARMFPRRRGALAAALASDPVRRSRMFTAGSPTASTWSAIRKAATPCKRPEPQALTTTPISRSARSICTENRSSNSWELTRRLEQARS